MNKTRRVCVCVGGGAVTKAGHLTPPVMSCPNYYVRLVLAVTHPEASELL